MSTTTSAVAALLERQAHAHGDRTAIRERSRAIGYAELAHSVAARAASFDALGEDAVLLFQPRRDIDSLVTVLAGLVSAPLILIADPAWGSSELDGVVARCGVTHHVGGHGETHAAPPAPSDGRALSDGASRRGADRGTVSFGRFTSGSTGSRRCLGFSEETALAAASTWATAAGLTADDRVACCAAFHNGLAFNTSLLSAVGAGAEVLLPGERLLPSGVARIVEEHDATRLVAFPFFLDLVVQQGMEGRYARVRQIVSSADKLQARTAEALRDVAPICDYYGLAEVGPCTFNDGSRLGSVGRPLPGASVRVLQENVEGEGAGDAAPGRVAVRTGWMAEGYVDGDAEEWSAHFSDGHYLTSDIGRTDGDYLVLEGRIGRIVNVGGRKIDPAEIEEALRRIDGVAHAHVLAVRVHDRPALAAFVESASLSRTDIVRSLSGQLADYKIPSAIRVMERLPRGEAGKVSRERLLAEFEEGLARS